MDKSNFKKLKLFIEELSDKDKKEMPHIILAASENSDKSFATSKSIYGSPEHLMAMLISAYNQYPRFRTLVKESLQLYPKFANALDKKKQLN